MRNGKVASRAKQDTNSRNGVPDKGVSLSGPRSNVSASDSDDDDVMRQLLSTPENRGRAAGHGRAMANGQAVTANGPASDSDDRNSVMSQDEDLSRRGRRPRNARDVQGPGPDSSAITPVGSPSQTSGPNTSSSEGVPPSSDKMDVDSDGRVKEDRTGRIHEQQAKESRDQSANSQHINPPPIPYVACHTWPPCGVCAGIAGIPAATLSAARRQRPPPFFPPSVSTEPFRYDPETAPRRAPSPPEFDIPRIPSPETPPRSTDNTPRPAGDASPTTVPLSPNASHVPPRSSNERPTFLPQNYPMEPLFVSAGVVMRAATFKTLTPAHMAARVIPSPPIINSFGRQSTLASVTAPIGAGPYSRVPQRNAHASSSSVRVEDMDEPEGRVPGLTTKYRGKGKFRAARHSGRKQRAKRYNRKKREEWPPDGWNPIWEEERPRNWGDYHIPDDVVTDKVYDHLKKRFDLKSAGVCNWEGCKPANPDDPSYKMLKRHVETVHLGLKLVCQLCGVRKRADNRRKATHKRGCPEREEDAVKPRGAIAVKVAQSLNHQGGADEPEEGSAEEDGAEDEEEEEDELEEDELDEEDELQDDLGEGEADGGDKDQPMVESEFESEDD